MLFKTIGIVAIFMFVTDENDLVLYILIMAITTMLANLSMWIYLPRYVCKITFTLRILYGFEDLSTFPINNKDFNIKT